MLSCLMELQIFSLLVIYLKFTLKRFQLCVGLKTLYPYFPNDVSKIPVVNQTITYYKAIYKLFGSGIYYKAHYILKSKSYEFHYRKIGLFSGNDTIMADYFIGMHIYLCMRKALLDTVSSAEFNTTALNSVLSKVISYIKGNTYWGRIYVLLKTLFPCIRVICLADISKAGMYKLFYTAIMTKMFIIK